MKQGLSLRVSQHLALTPQLQQSIRLLQLSTLELAQEVEQMLDDNPFLEVHAGRGAARGVRPGARPTRRPREDEREAEPRRTLGGRRAPSTAPPRAAPKPKPAADAASDAPDWDGDGTHRDRARRRRVGRRRAGAHATTWATTTRSTPPSWRAATSRCRPACTARRWRCACREEDRAALRFLIESLNDDGYLEDSLRGAGRGPGAATTCEQQEELVHRFTVALRLLQSLEPRRRGRALPGRMPDAAAARAAADGDADEDVRRPRWRSASSRSTCWRGATSSAWRSCAASNEAQRARPRSALITRLEPKPGRRFVDVERNIVVPDVLVTQVGRGASASFRVQLNPDVMPRLRVHDVYAGALKAHKGEGHQALQQRLQEARWFIKNIQQRFDTILRVSNAIVERQKNFFIHGELAMRPLVLREIADELGLHESTISPRDHRQVHGDALRHLRAEVLLRLGAGHRDRRQCLEHRGARADQAVRRRRETPKKPLSDSQISEMLKEQGIECARRTVAKYREALRIAPANLRKAL